MQGPKRPPCLKNVTLLTWGPNRPPWLKNVTLLTRGPNRPFRCLDLNCSVSAQIKILFKLVGDAVDDTDWTLTNSCQHLDVGCFSSYFGKRMSVSPLAKFFPTFPSLHLSCVQLCWPKNLTEATEINYSLNLCSACQTPSAILGYTWGVFSEEGP